MTNYEMYEMWTIGCEELDTVRPEVDESEYELWED